MLRKLQIPFYSLPGDLESFVVNKNTVNFAESVFEKYYEDAFDSYVVRTEHFDGQSKLNELRKVIGSKRFEIKKIPNTARGRKKPHIPLEIISDYIEYLEKERLLSSEKILEDFIELKLLITIIEEKLQ